jgi:phosphatidylethanolamine/phosphatidyl-N-methylethanolamine N-methyltransferase
MKINTNLWNKIRYTAMAPVYDIAGKLFSAYRKLSIEQLNIIDGDKVLIIGAGTGLDLEFIPKHAVITATDITPAMINMIEKRNQSLGFNLTATVMDGQQLELADKSYDKIILHLILAVIPDLVACIKEAERVLKDDGRIVVYDKFLPGHITASFGRKTLNLFTNFFFSDINRKFEEIVSHTQLKTVKITGADFRGNYKIYVLEKQIIQIPIETP